MRRFRTQWLALFGALVILSLSISSVFAARPVVTDTSSSFGGQVSTFVHLLLSDTNDDTTADEGGEDENSDSSDECQPASDEDGTEDGTTEDGTSNQDAADESGDEDTSTADCADQSDEDSSDDSSADNSGAEDSAAPTAQNHGQCVAEIARDMTQLGENGTHGWAVVLAAQVTCWLDLNGDQTGDTGDENSGSDENSGTEEGATNDTSTASTKPHGKSDAAHQHKLDRAGHGKPTWVSSSTHGGQGKGHRHAHGH